MKQYIGYAILAIIIMLCNIPLFAGKSQTVAVIPFDGNVISESEARALSDVLENRLVQLNNFELVERNRIENIMEELKFSSSDFVNTETAVEAGKLLSAHFLVLGTISQIGETFNINVKLVNTETGLIVHAADGEGRNINRLKNTVEGIAKTLSKYLITQYTWSIDAGITGLVHSKELHSMGINLSALYAIRNPLAIGVHVGGYVKLDDAQAKSLTYGGKILVGDPRRFAVSVTISHFPSVGLYYKHVFLEVSPLMFLGKPETMGITLGYSITN